MLAPYSLIAKSKPASGRPVVSALAWISGKLTPCSRWSSRAVASCRALLSVPTGRAPARASHAEVTRELRPGGTLDQTLS